MFPFIKFPGVDPILGPEMKSTGEVMGVGRDFGEAYAKAQLVAPAWCCPRQGKALLSACANATRKRRRRTRPRTGDAGLRPRRHRTARRQGADSRGRYRLSSASTRCKEGRPHIVDMIKNGEIDLIVNTTEGKQAIADRVDPRAAARAAAHHGHLLHDARVRRGNVVRGDGTSTTSDVNRLQDLHGEVERHEQGAHDRYPQGAELLQEELKKLKTEERPAPSSRRSPEARAHGDLKENAEYHAAASSRASSRAASRRSKASCPTRRSSTSPTLTPGGKVVFGATVELLDVDTDEER